MTIIKNKETNSEKSFLLKMNIIYVLCIVLHLFYGVFGLLSNVVPLIVYNILGCALYFYLLNLNKKGYSFLAAVISLIDILSYTVLMTFLIGTNIMFHTILLSVIAMTFTLDSKVSSKIKIFTAIFTGFIYMFIESGFISFNPLYSFTENQIQLLRITNSFIAIMPILYIMTVYDNFRLKLITEEQNTSRLLSSIKHLINETNNKTLLIESSIESIDNAVNKSNESINNIENKSQHVLSSQQENFSSVESVVLEVNKLKKGLKSLKEQSNNIYTESNNASIFINDGFEQIKQVNSDVELLQTNSNEIKELMTKLSDAISLINNTSNVIVSIAQSTNMLSLNASIESSRNGANKNGFGVIASEIRSLADQCKYSSTEIVNTTNEIFDRIKKVSNSIDINNILISNVYKAVQETNMNFNNILTSIDSIINQVDSINNLSENELISINNLALISNELNSTIEKTLFSCTDIADEISNQVIIEDDIREHISKLNTLSLELKNTVEKIKP